MADLAELELRISSLEVEVATKRLERLTQAGANSERMAGLLSRQFDALNGTIQKVRILGSFLAAGFIATRVANSALIETTKDYETALVTLKAVAIDTNQSLAAQADQFAELDKAARSVGQTTQFSAVEAAAGLLTLAKAGLTAKESIATLPAVLNFAQGQLVSVDQAADTVTNVLRQFGISAADASRVTDVLSQTANKTSTDVTNLSVALKFVGPIAAALGRDLEEVSAALGVLANSGLQGSLAGTTLRGVLTALTGPSDQAKKAIKSLGLTVSELDPSTHSIEEIITKLAGSFIGTSEAVDIFNKRNAATALILTNNLGPLRELIKAEEESRGLTLKLAKAQDDTLAGAFKRLGAAMKDVILNQDFFKKGLRETTEFLIGLFHVFAGATDPITKANEAVQAFAAAIRYTTVIMAVLLGFQLGSYFSNLAASILTAAGATAKLNAIASVNPFIALGTAIASIYLSVKLLNGELSNAEEQAGRIGSRIDDTRFKQLAQDLSRLNIELEDAAKNKDFEKQIDLLTAKANTLKSELTNVKLSIKQDPNNSTILLSDFNKIVESAFTDQKIRTKIEVEVGKDQLDRATKSIFSNLKDSLARENKDALTSEFGKVFEEALKPLQGRVFLPVDKIKEFKAEFVSLLQKVSENKNVFVTTTFLSPDVHVLGNLNELKDAINENQPLFDKFFKEVSEKLVNLNTLLELDQASAFGKQGEVIADAIAEINKEIDTAKENSKGSFFSFIKQNTEEDIIKVTELAEEAEKASQAIDNFALSLGKEKRELLQTFGLSDLDAQAKKKQLEAYDLLEEASSKRLKAIRDERAAKERLLEGAIQDPAGAEKEGTSADKIRGRLAVLAAQEAELTGEIARQKSNIDALIVSTTELAKARKEAEEFNKREETGKESIIQNLLALKAENDALEDRNNIAKAVAQSDRDQIELNAAIRSSIAQLVGGTELQKNTTDELIDSYVEEASRKSKLVTENERLAATKKQLARDTRTEGEALRKLVQDLNAEIASIGQDNVTKEVNIRLRRISAPLIDSEDTALQKAGQDLEDELRPSVEVVTRALDQSKRAEQLGREVGRAFADPIKDILKGGSIEDAAKSLLERLFDIFLEITIFKPLEDKLAEIFSKNRKLGAIGTGKEAVTDEQLTKAEDLINETSVRLLHRSGDNLKQAFNAGDYTAEQLLEAARKLKEAFMAFVGPKPPRLVSAPGPKLPNTPIPPTPASPSETEQAVINSIGEGVGGAANATQSTTNTQARARDPREYNPFYKQTDSNHPYASILPKYMLRTKEENEEHDKQVTKEIIEFAEQQKIRNTRTEGVSPEEIERFKAFKFDKIPDPVYPTIPISQARESLLKKSRAYYGPDFRDEEGFLQLPSKNRIKTPATKVPELRAPQAKRVESPAMSIQEILERNANLGKDKLKPRDPTVTLNGEPIRSVTPKPTAEKQAKVTLEGIKELTKPGKLESQPGFSPRSVQKPISFGAIGVDLQKQLAKPGLLQSKLSLTDLNSSVEKLNNTVKTETSSISKVEDKLNLSIKTQDKATKTEDKLTETVKAQESAQVRPSSASLIGVDLQKKLGTPSSILKSQVQKVDLSTSSTSKIEQSVEEGVIKATKTTSRIESTDKLEASSLTSDISKTTKRDKTEFKTEKIEQSLANLEVTIRQESIDAIGAAVENGIRIGLEGQGLVTPQTKENKPTENTLIEAIGTVEPTTQNATANLGGGESAQQLAIAAGQITAAFASLPVTSGNLETAASLLRQAVPALNQAAQNLKSVGNAQPQGQPQGSGGGQPSFTQALGSGVFGQLKGFLGGYLSNLLGFSIPLAKGAVFNNSSVRSYTDNVVTAFENGGIFDSKVSNIVNNSALSKFATGGVFNTASNSESSINSTTSKVTAFASGGKFTNTVVNKPTMAPMALFGEAGPEAIMPLKRSKSGQLGVVAFAKGKEAMTLPLTRGSGGKLGIDFSSITSNTNKYATGATIYEGKEYNSLNKFSSGEVITNAVSNVNSFAKGSVFKTYTKNELGDMFGDSQTNRYGIGSMTSSADVSNTTNETNDNSRSNQVTFNNVYNFGPGTSKQQKDEFKRAARHHEQDLRDRSRRTFGS